MFAGVERMRSTGDFKMTNGYSLPSSIVILRLVLSVERVIHLTLAAVSWKTTSRYSGECQLAWCSFRFHGALAVVARTAPSTETVTGLVLHSVCGLLEIGLLVGCRNNKA